MVAPAYAAARTSLAKSMGLGQRECKSRQAALFDCRCYRACGGESGKGQAYPERGLAPLFVRCFAV